MNVTPMRVVERVFDLLDSKRVIVVELANGRRLSFKVDPADARFFNEVPERDVCMTLRPLVPEEWSMERYP